MGERRYFVRGEVDLGNAPQLHAALYKTIEATEDDLAVDCSGLTFIDSTGATVLSAVAQTLVPQGRAFRIVNADDGVERVFELMGLSDILHVNEDTRADGRAR